MENQLQVFGFDGKEVRVIMIDGEPWFVGKDVANILGHSNPSKALGDHVDAEDKFNNESFSSLGQRGGWIINETGLYSLIFKSRVTNKKRIEMIEFIHNHFSDKNNISISLPERKEIQFIEMLEESLKPLKLTLRKQVKVLDGKYRLDGLIPELNLAIEYDEKAHSYQSEEDRIREQEIKELYGCEFVRLKEENSHTYNIGLVMKHIVDNYPILKQII